VARVTGQRARSTLPLADTPDCQAKQSGAPDGLSRPGAEAAWHAVTAAIAGTPHVRISKDGGRTYPARHARALPAEPPDQPCTVPVYDPGSATGRMLAHDLARPRIAPTGDSPSDAVAHQGAELDHQGAELDQLLERLGATYIADVSPSGGRHVYVLFAAALPWLDLRDVGRPSIDTAPMSPRRMVRDKPGRRRRDLPVPARAGAPPRNNRPSRQGC
jgi:hypothetical protein